MWKIYFFDSLGRKWIKETVKTEEEAEKRVEELNNDNTLDYDEYYEAWKS